MSRRMTGGLGRWVVVAALASCDAQPAEPPGGFRDTSVGVDATAADDTAAAADDAVADSAAADTVPPAPPIAPGNVVWRRLNRTEYRNTVRDLLGTRLDPGKDLPSDDLGYGFDNVASVLTMSPLHLELYQRAAAMLAAEVTSVPITTEVDETVEAETLPLSVDYGAAQGTYFVLWSQGELTTDVELPKEATWRVEVRGWESHAGDEPALVATWVDGALVQTFALSEAVADHAIEMTLSAGRHAIGVEFINDYYDASVEPAADRNVFIDRFGVRGPVPLEDDATSAWGRHVKCQPAVMRTADVAARTCAADTVRALADRAWRRPGDTAAGVESLMTLYDLAVADGAPPTEALAVPIEALLMSPRFLFKAEMPRDGTALDGFEVATRLSYFLWSTMPDEALFAAAASGKLGDAAGIADEVARMLEDPKAEALVANFAGQWLYVRDVDNAIPDPWAFPEFDEPLRHAMAEEMRLFFRSFVFEDRSMIELLTATDTWVNRRLAEHYGLPEAAVPADDETWVKTAVAGVGRRGVLSEAGLLTALSTPFRTSIVRRGKWVLSQLLCDTPSDPPPGVVGLIDGTPEGQAPRTLREKMELHKTEERCRTCHETMDAIGFGLEGFDGVGMARTTDNGFPIDTASTLHGEAFDGAVQLAGLIAADPRLPRCMVDKLAIYALGRGLAGEDEPLLQRLYADFAARGYRFPALVELIATSEAFRQREGIR